MGMIDGGVSGGKEGAKEYQCWGNLQEKFGWTGTWRYCVTLFLLFVYLFLVTLCVYGIGFFLFPSFLSCCVYRRTTHTLSLGHTSLSAAQRPLVTQ